ncbi:MAG TPA: Ni/Fe hydrogenase subunit alpha, partial [Aggregatilineales bacterium]|nr:Ni/Fe hydrogenase subunit alpha [Aggregatilineales bacterium]
MTRNIVVEPVTRIEGHAKITLQLGDDGHVHDARFHVTQVRGFEKFCEGRPFYEMPSLMARICGICPVSHLMASAKACDALLAVRIPETAIQLRRVMNLGQIIQSHALSFFYLSSPDFLLGMDSDPAKRNVIGLIQAAPQLGRDGIRLRQIGQTIIELLGGKRIHPAWVVPGGVSEPLSKEKRDQILTMLPDAQAIVLGTIDWFRDELDHFQNEIASFANFESMYMGLVGPNGEIEHYNGALRLVDPKGHILVDDRNPFHYADYIAEAIEPWTYLKFTYYKPMGYPNGLYRVGPLARLKVAERCGTPLADEKLVEFRSIVGEARNSSFHYHYARLIEILHAVEKVKEILSDPEILNPRVRAHAEPNATEGVGISEAPRG